MIELAIFAIVPPIDSSAGVILGKTDAQKPETDDPIDETVLTMALPMLAMNPQTMMSFL
jgi:hypothetical protein